MAAPTKAEKYCKANYTISVNEEAREFHFKPKDPERLGTVVSFDTHPTLKEACAYIQEIDIKGDNTKTPPKASEFDFVKEITKKYTVENDGQSWVFTPKDTKIKSVFNVDSAMFSNESEACEWLYNYIQENGEPQPPTRLDVFKEAAKKFPTDKMNHGYIPLYAEKLPEKPKALLEIGCYKGDSIRMWKELFPESKIATLDLFQEYGFPDIDGVQFYKGSQSDGELLELIALDNYDVVIDDGSHGAKDQWLVIDKFLKPRVTVVIEDLHCNFDGKGFWNQGLKESDTILGRIKSGTFPYNHELFLDKIVFIYG